MAYCEVVGHWWCTEVLGRIEYYMVGVVYVLLKYLAIPSNFGLTYSEVLELGTLQ